MPLTLTEHVATGSMAIGARDRGLSVSALCDSEPTHGSGGIDGRGEFHSDRCGVFRPSPGGALNTESTQRTFRV